MDERLVQQFFANDYQDRGMQKWQGYFLSDHTQRLRHSHQALQQSTKWQMIPQMDGVAINRELQLAVEKHQAVTVIWKRAVGLEAEYFRTSGQITGWEAGMIRIGTQMLATELVVALKRKN
ncbi:hypothetical protein M3M39_04425 [Fructilactobacillus hinvesii]|uniref:DNA-directed RNA polymerase n=1 Tax=Fructilactobacillus hinvesii TaxID=2940300 RepID=A0ABY5BXB4_9LACO|nr:hypothetical protein [Fructilactobacillus hinvesii]USS88626.1 hypothetical protein M3M39_04425 [Fructilactobacillus hinvesii]